MQRAAARRCTALGQAPGSMARVPSHNCVLCGSPPRVRRRSPSYDGYRRGSPSPPLRRRSPSYSPRRCVPSRSAQSRQLLVLLMHGIILTPPGLCISYAVHVMGGEDAPGVYLGMSSIIVIQCLERKVIVPVPLTRSSPARVRERSYSR